MKFSINHLPKTPAELENLTEDYSATAEGAVVFAILALNLASNNISLTSAVMKLVYPDISHSMVQLIERQLNKSPYVIRSYFSNTSPGNNYSIPENNLEVVLSTNKYSGTVEDGKIKFFVDCSGADSPRPITVKRDSNQSWSAREFSSLIVGIRAPIE